MNLCAAANTSAHDANRAEPPKIAPALRQRQGRQSRRASAQIELDVVGASLPAPWNHAPPTPAQHASTIETITNLIAIGSGDLVHQKKDGNSPKHRETRAGKSQAEECSSRAFAFVKAVLEGTVDNGETFSPCQFITPKSRNSKSR